MSWLAALIRALQEKREDMNDIRVAAEMLGLKPEEVNDPSIKCVAVLQSGLTPDICRDFRGIRRWVMCRAWDLLETKRAETFREAIREAWREAHLACGGAL